jgi:streptogramin lyase
MSSYRDSFSTVSAGSQAANYASLDTYSVQAIPRYSMLKMTVAPGAEKYFNTSREFQARETSPRAGASSQYPVNLEGASPTFASVRNERQVVADSEYSQLGYKLSPK